MSKQYELRFDDEPVYKSSPIVDVEPVSNETNMKPPPLTRRLNIELEGLGELDLQLDLVKDDSLDCIIEG